MLRFAAGLWQSDSVVGANASWLRRLARGEYGLRRTYWLGWGLGGGIASAPIVLLAVAAEAIGSVVAMALACVCGIAIYGGYNALAMIGVWRAADAHPGWRGWAIWAKANVGLACIGLTIAALGLPFVLVLRLVG